MMKNTRNLIGLGILAVVVILGLAGYMVFRTPQAASGPIEALPLAQSSAGPASTNAAAQTPGAATTSAPTQTVASATASQQTTPSAAGTGARETAASAAGPIVAQIVQEESEARFVIDEVLNNAPKTVVGATNQVAGEIAVDPQDPPKTRVGTIQVNVRGLATDSEFRDRAIKNRILNTDQFEFVTFAPTQIVGLPANGSVGQSYSFQIIGDLTVRDVTKAVTFDVTANPISETRLEGTAQTTIRYADFGLTIPQVRQVARVSDQVRLEIDFVAVPK